MFEENYLVERRLGSGGFSDVFLATDIVLERKVALKILRPLYHVEERRWEVARARFFQEARVLARLDGNHVVRVHAYDELEGQLLYMALEYVEGLELDILIQGEGGLSLERSIGLVEQILLGLREVHALEILHRDLKPRNIMVTNRFGEESVKLLDFGIAKVLSARDRLDLTSEGNLIGTPRYLTPEQLMGNELTPATDLYAVGLLFYEMLTGQPVHADSTLDGLITRVHGLASEIAESGLFRREVADVLARFLATSPGDRFSDAEEALEAMGALRGLEGGFVSADTLDDIVLEELDSSGVSEAVPMATEMGSAEGVAQGSAPSTGEIAASGTAAPARPTDPATSTESVELAGDLRPRAGIFAAVGVGLLLSAIAFGWISFGEDDATGEEVVGEPAVTASATPPPAPDQPEPVVPAVPVAEPEKVIDARPGENAEAAGGVVERATERAAEEAVVAARAAEEPAPKVRAREPKARSAGVERVEKPKRKPAVKQRTTKSTKSTKNTKNSPGFAIEPVE